MVWSCLLPKAGDFSAEPILAARNDLGKNGRAIGCGRGCSPQQASNDLYTPPLETRCEV
jgi:hypothetical protein